MDTPSAAAQALTHGLKCKGDKVVRVNSRTGVYHFQGERYFGSTKQGNLNANMTQTKKAIDRREMANEEGIVWGMIRSFGTRPPY